MPSGSNRGKSQNTRDTHALGRRLLVRGLSSRARTFLDRNPEIDYATRRKTVKHSRGEDGFGYSAASHLVLNAVFMFR